jgi:hypothetical protein
MKTKIKILIGVALLAIIFFKKIVVIGMIVVGYFLFPEASQALRHYCFGDGSDLHVSADYIKTSPVVQKHLANMQIGEKKKNVGFKQADDWRLSFVLNPFTIHKKKDKVVITQWMKFDSKGEVFTLLYFIPVPDNIVHTFDCTPYMLRCEWNY